MALPPDPSMPDEYNEDSDEDFDPAAVPTHPAESSSDEDEPGPKRQKASLPKPARRENDEESELDFDNSGDESTIQSGRKRKRKSASGNPDDEDGGEGGFVKTRAQRKAGAAEKKPLADMTTAKVDVDALWADMSGASSTPQRSQATIATDEIAHTPARQDPASSDEPSVIIKRKYDFAGQTIEEERKVSASSAEARLFLAEQQRTAPHPDAAKPATNRPRKRRAPFAALGAAPTPATAGLAKGPKLNTLEKSKLDWAAHVDKEGIADELDEASRAKGSYLAQVDFLGRMDSKRQEDLRNHK